MTTALRAEEPKPQAEASATPTETTAVEPRVNASNGADGTTVLPSAPTDPHAQSEASASAAGPRSAPSDEVKQLRQEVEQLRADFEESRTSAESDETLERKIEFYGFMDMGLQKIWASDDSAVIATGSSRASTFVLGNVNLYIDANPNPIWRGLTELRITNYPNDALITHGIPALGRSEERVNTTIYDINSPDPGWNKVTWSALVLEQAWIQGTPTDWFGVRVGYWRTPFGIWNVDHGSPTVIGLTRPQFTRGHFYPAHQLGVQAFGHVNVAAWKLGYMAYVSNGKTPGALDITNDKAFGLRLSAQTKRPFPMAFGLAGYTGRYSHQVLTAIPPALITPVATEDIAYRQWDVGADASIDIGTFRLRTEVAVERVNYEAGKHELVWNIPDRLTPNRTMVGWYSLGAYRLPWLGLEPYLSFELYRYPSPLGEAIMVPGVGLNLHINTEVQIKSQFTRTHFFDFSGGADRSQQDLSMFASRLVMAY